MGFGAATLQVFLNTNHFNVSSQICFPNKKNCKDLRYELKKTPATFVLNPIKLVNISLKSRTKVYNTIQYIQYKSDSWMKQNFKILYKGILSWRTDSPELQFWFYSESESERGKETERGKG